MSQKAPIQRVSPSSLAKVFCIYYLFCGFTFGIAYLFQGHPSVYAPLGFVTLFLSVRLNLVFYPQDNFLSKLGYAIWSLPCYGISGWLTGFLGAFLYNWCSSFLGLQIQAEYLPEAGIGLAPEPPKSGP